MMTSGCALSHHCGIPQVPKMVKTPDFWGPGEKAEWRNGGMVEWRNGGMAE